jgi:hypothetical protein
MESDQGHERLTPQLESEEHSVCGQEDEAETSTHGEEIIELGTGGYTLSPSAVDDGGRHWVGVMESSGKYDCRDLCVSRIHVSYAIGHTDRPRSEMCI